MHPMHRITSPTAREGVPCRPPPLPIPHPPPHAALAPHPRPTPAPIYLCPTPRPRRSPRRQLGSPAKGPAPAPLQQQQHDGRSNISSSTLNLLNCILGAGILGYPYCFKSCGVVLGTLLLLVSVAASRFSYSLLLYSSQISNKRTYEELAEQAVGRAGRQIVVLCTAAINLGCIVAYLNILADVLSSVAGTIIPPGAEPSRNSYIAGARGSGRRARANTPRGMAGPNAVRCMVGGGSM